MKQNVCRTATINNLVQLNYNQPNELNVPCSFCEYLHFAIESTSQQALFIFNIIYRNDLSDTLLVSEPLNHIQVLMDSIYLE